MIFGLLHRAVRRRLVRRGANISTKEMKHCSLQVLTSNPGNARSTLLLIHGLGTSSSTWLHILPTLARTHRVHAVDLPGFGMSELKGGKPYLTLQEQTDALAEYVKQNIPEQFSIIGHSLGGWLGMRLALMFEERVPHLLLINTAGVHYPGMERQRDIFQIENRHDVRRLIDLMWHRYPWYVRPSMGWIHRELRRRRVAEIVRSITLKDFVNSQLNKLSMPVTILWGREDRLVSPEVALILQRELKKPSLHYIEECGHVPQLEKPRECLQLLQRSLAEYSS